VQSLRNMTFPSNNVAARVMEYRNPRWRFRISTLMLLVIIAALALTLVINRRNWQLERERLRTSVLLHSAQTDAANSRANQAETKAQSLQHLLELAESQPQQADMKATKDIQRSRWPK
jgi:hypothetical protein